MRQPHKRRVCLRPCIRHDPCVRARMRDRERPGGRNSSGSRVAAEAAAAEAEPGTGVRQTRVVTRMCGSARLIGPVRRPAVALATSGPAAGGGPGLLGPCPRSYTQLGEAQVLGSKSMPLWGWLM